MSDISCMDCVMDRSKLKGLLCDIQNNWLNETQEAGD